jgi:hypothetical protein
MKCIIRPDIIKDGYLVRIGDEWVASEEIFQYRWIDNQFQILFNDEWKNADSVDFTFL